MLHNAVFSEDTVSLYHSGLKIAVKVCEMAGYSHQLSWGYLKEHFTLCTPAGCLSKH